MVVPVDAASAIGVGPQTSLFDVASASPMDASYAPSPDGRRFLVLDAQSPASFWIKLTLNWAEFSAWVVREFEVVQDVPFRGRRPPELGPV